MSIQEQAQEELAWAEHYERKAERETDLHMKAEWVAQAQRAREVAAQLYERHFARVLGDEAQP
jgi:hypothetical protein